MHPQTGPPVTPTRAFTPASGSCRVIRSPEALPGAPIERDRARYTEMLGEAVRAALPRIVGEMPVMTSPDGQLVAVPVPFLDLPRFRRAAAPEREPPAGIGRGPGRPGDVIARRPRRGGERGGGDEERRVLVWLDRQALQDLVFADLRLPALRPTVSASLESEAARWTSRRDRGPATRLDRKATLKASLTRRLILGAEAPVLATRDLRYITWRDRVRPRTQAVVGLLRDVSGSMDDQKVYLSHAVAWWLVSWLRSRYQRVALAFWLHDTHGWAVDEATFFRAGSGGGTRAAGAYEAMARSWRITHPPENWNWYLFHFTDGDDYDPEAAREVLLREWVDTASLLGVVQLSGAGEWSRLVKALRGLPNPPVRVAQLKNRDDVGSALVDLLAEGGERDGAAGRLG